MNLTDLHVYSWPITPEEKAEQRRLIKEGQDKGWAVSLCADMANRRTTLLRSANMEHIAPITERVMVMSGFLHRRKKPTTQENAA